MLNIAAARRDANSGRTLCNPRDKNIMLSLLDSRQEALLAGIGYGTDEGAEGGGRYDDRLRRQLTRMERQLAEGDEPIVSTGDDLISYLDVEHAQKDFEAALGEIPGLHPRKGNNAAVVEAAEQAINQLFRADGTGYVGASKVAGIVRNTVTVLEQTETAKGLNEYTLFKLQALATTPGLREDEVRAQCGEIIARNQVPKWFEPKDYFALGEDRALVHQTSCNVRAYKKVPYCFSPNDDGRITVTCNGSTWNGKPFGTTYVDVYELGGEFVETSKSKPRSNKAEFSGLDPNKAYYVVAYRDEYGRGITTDFDVTVQW